MSNNFEQISLKPGFMKHNGGVLFRSISETEYEFKSKISENHLNSLLVDRPELESGVSRFVAECLIQFGQRSIV